MKQLTLQTINIGAGISNDKDTNGNNDDTEGNEDFISKVESGNLVLTIDCDPQMSTSNAFEHIDKTDFKK